jgi:hypothetical protein
METGMLHAIRARDCDNARRLLGVALALLLVFRLLLGPALLPTPEPGLVPICTGARIVYVVPDGGPGAPGPALSDPCPFFGFTAAPAPPGEPVAPPRYVAFSGHPVPAILSPPGRTWRAGHSPRAPPPPA